MKELIADRPVLPPTLTGCFSRTAPKKFVEATTTTALSTVAQSVGYLIAAAGPFGLGLLHAGLGTWTAPLAILVALSAVQLVLGYRLSGAGK